MGISKQKGLAIYTVKTISQSSAIESAGLQAVLHTGIFDSRSQAASVLAELVVEGYLHCIDGRYTVSKQGQDYIDHYNGGSCHE